MGERSRENADGTARQSRGFDRGRGRRPRSLSGRRACSALSAGALAEAASSLSQRVGIDGVTMKRVGEELGVSTMAAYRHVSTRQELLDLAAETVLNRVVAADPHQGSWGDRMRPSLCLASRALGQAATDERDAARPGARRRRRRVRRPARSRLSSLRATELPTMWRRGLAADLVLGKAVGINSPLSSDWSIINNS